LTFFVPFIILLYSNVLEPKVIGPLTYLVAFNISKFASLNVSLAAVVFIIIYSVLVSLYSVFFIFPTFALVRDNKSFWKSILLGVNFARKHYLSLILITSLYYLLYFAIEYFSSKIILFNFLSLFDLIAYLIFYPFLFISLAKIFSSK
jgi:hypothetical protein